MNDPEPASGDAASQRAGTNDDEDQRPEPHGEDDPAPEEAGYGYGV